MAFHYNFPCIKLVVIMIIITLAISSSSADHTKHLLSHDFYSQSCPNLFSIVRKIVGDNKDAKSLLLLHIHDCISAGCDASILLDDTSPVKGVKGVFQSQSSAFRNTSTTNIEEFEVVDQIKSAVEAECPGVVSCADILAIAAKESVSLTQGFDWNVKLGRRDVATEKKFKCKHPGWALKTTGFNAFGFSTKDVVALFEIGRHSKKQVEFEKYKHGHLSKAISSFHQHLLGWEKTESIAMKYSKNTKALNEDFSTAMVKISEFRPLTGSQGEIRTNCRRIN